MFRAVKDRILSLNGSSHVHPVLIVDTLHSRFRRCRCVYCRMKLSLHVHERIALRSIIEAVKRRNGGG